MPVFPSVGSTEWNEVATTHLYNFLQRDPADNYTKPHPTLAWLRRGQSTTGGGKPAWPVFFGTDATGRSYLKGQVINIADAESHTMAETEMSFRAEAIAVYHTDQQRAKGPDALFDLLEAKTKTKKAALMRQQNTVLWAASKSATTDPDSIPLAIPVDPTSSGAFCGLNGAAGQQTFWRNQTATSTGSLSSDGIIKIDAMLNSLAEEGGDADILVTTKAIYQWWQQLIRGKHQVNLAPGSSVKKLQDLGVPMISHNGIPVIHDSGCPTGKVFALKEGAIEWVANEGGDFTMADGGFESTKSTGVMGSVAMLRLEGFLKVTNRRLLGQVDSITAV